MQEITYSLKEINGMLSGLGRSSKKIQVETANLGASILIKAIKKIKKQKTFEETDRIREQITSQLKRGDIPKDAIMEYYDNRIDSLKERIDVIEKEKLKNGGTLRRGRESALNALKVTYEEVKAEKEKHTASLNAEQKIKDNENKSIADREEAHRKEELAKIERQEKLLEEQKKQTILMEEKSKEVIKATEKLDQSLKEIKEKEAKEAERPKNLFERITNG